MRIALDIETNLAHDKVWLVKTLNTETGEVLTWKEAGPLQGYVEAATSVCAHNLLGFDRPVLQTCWNVKIPLEKSCDTLILSRLLDPSREGGHSLEAWGKTLGTKKVEYRRIWEWLQDRKEEYPGECFDRPHMPLLEYYCEGDVLLLQKLHSHLQSELKAKGFSEESVELEHKVAQICQEMELNGFKLDTVKATLLLVDWQGRLSKLAERAQELYPPVVTKRFHAKTGKPLKDSVAVFNLSSRLQVVEKLKALGWTPEKKTELGTPILDEAVLDEILKDAQGEMKELAEVVKENLLLVKRIGQVESWLERVKSDGRVHGRMITNGAVTGRGTHMDPNMGQVPNASALYGPECRECWTVEDGNVQVGVDLSGIELRCLSHYMNDPEWQEELLNGDVHWKNTQAFGLVPMGTEKTDSKDHKDARNLSKTLCYSVLYGAGPSKVGSYVKGSAKDGKKLVDNFINNTPGLKRLKKKLEPYIAKGYVPGLDGRKVWIRSDHAALNSLLQSAGAIIAKQWLVCFTEAMEALKVPYKLLAWVHDEIQVETKPEYGDVVGKAAVEAARKAGEILKFRCPVDAEYRIGRNWKECH
jgi:DNA polymerase I-like protein with 3'-5' exonuclease and polymerase domains